MLSRVSHSTVPGVEEMHRYGGQSPAISAQAPATSVHVSMTPMPASPAGFRST